MSSTEALRAALAQLAAEDLGAVLEEARAGARARAREVIEDILTEEIVAAAAAADAPRRDREARRGADGHALWAYCVLSAPDAAALAQMAGIEAGSAVECVVEGALAALVSEVPLAEYDDERLREHLNDIDWVERTARAHEEVLESALSECTIVPLRLCTLFHDRDRVRAFLRDERAHLTASLQALAGRAEWGVKLFVDGAQLQASLASAGDGEPESDGKGYIGRKQRERAAREAVDEAMSSYASIAHDRLAAVADAAHANPVQRREAHGRDAEMVLNGVYLVAREHESELTDVVDALRAEWGAEGVDLELTGPWPGYNFVAGAEAAAS